MSSDAPTTGATALTAGATADASGPPVAGPGSPVAEVLFTEDLSVGHGSRVVCAGIDLEIAPGRLTVVVGPNGCGKSTLLRTMARLQPPLGGTVRLGDDDLGRLRPRDVARRVAFLPQSPLVPEGVTVRQLVGYGRHPHQGILGTVRDDDRDAVAWALGATGLDPLADRLVDTLSGGERQRAWIAMTLAQRTGVLLLDEPTTFLDVRHQLDLMHLLRRLVSEHGLAVALVLHDLNQAAGFADHMLLLAGGGVVARGRPTEVLTAAHVRTAFEVDARVVVDDATGIPTCVFPGRDAALAP